MLPDGESQGGSAHLRVLLDAHDGGGVHLEVSGDLGAGHEVLRLQVLHPLQVSVGQLDDGALDEVRGVV